MSVAQQLALLQDIDLEIDHLNAQAATVQVALGETVALQEARTAWQGDEADLDKKRKAVQDREWDVKEGQAKITPVETNRMRRPCSARVGSAARSSWMTSVAPPGRLPGSV